MGKIPREAATSEAPVTLELVLLEMQMGSTNLIQEGFSASLLRAVDQLGGVVLFNLRLDDDEPFQRCAAVVLGQQAQDECVALAFLSRDGRRATVESAETCGHPLATKALKERQEITSDSWQSDNVHWQQNYPPRSSNQR